MSVIDEVLAANEIYSRTHELRKLTPRPERKLAVLTCMDTRLSIRTLGLKTGDAHVIRNAGGIVTEDTLRSLVVSHYLPGTEEIMVINHTDCGLMHTNEHDLRTRIQNRTGTAAVAPAFFYTFQNIDENVRHQLQKLRTHPWIPKNVAVRGFVYDVSSGLLREIKHSCNVPHLGIFLALTRLEARWLPRRRWAAGFSHRYCRCVRTPCRSKCSGPAPFPAQ